MSDSLRDPTDSKLPAVESSKASLHPLVLALMVAAIVLYLIAPWPIALDIGRENGYKLEYTGWPLLFFGWLGTPAIFDGRLDGLGWFANPLFLLVVVSVLIDRRPHVPLASAAAVFSITSFLLREVPVNEAGSTGLVIGHRAGFWLWLASIWIGLLTTIVMRLLRRPKSK